MTIRKIHLPRRTFLRGTGAALALPFLDCMLPAASAAPAPSMRLGVFYIPNGVIPRTWTPQGYGAGFEFSPSLKALEPFRDQTLILTGLNCEPAKAILG